MNIGISSGPGREFSTTSQGDVAEIEEAGGVSGVRASISTLQSELKAQRRKLEEFHVNIGHLSHQITAIAAEFESAKTNFVSFATLTELHANLKLEWEASNRNGLSPDTKVPGTSVHGMQAICQAVNEAISVAFKKGSDQQASAIDAIRQELQAVRVECGLAQVDDAIQRSTAHAGISATQAPEQALSHLTEQLPAGHFAVRFFRMHGEPLGLSYKHGDDRNTLLITEVETGLVRQWNSANPDKSVQSGDSLISINGVRDNIALLEDKLQHVGEFCCIFLSAGQSLKKKAQIHHF